MHNKGKVLITGATGLLGGNAARMLFREGFDIRILVRSSADLTAVADVPCEVYTGDICDPGEVAAAVCGCDYVVHAASVTLQWGVGYETYRSVNIGGTKNVVRACLQYGIKKLIYISTANTIGPGSRLSPATELDGFSLFRVNSGYINSKYIAQQYVLEQVAASGLPAVILNPSFIIGPYDAAPSSGRMILYGLKRKLLCCPPGSKNFVHVRDVCRGIVRALEHGAPGELFLMAGENLSYVEFFRKLAGITGRRVRIVRLPAFLLRTLGLIGTCWHRLTGRPVKLTLSAARLLCMDNYYSGRKSERELDLHYATTEQAIADAVEWFRTHKYC